MRTALGMSDADLARLLSVHRSTICRWEASGVGRQNGMLSLVLLLLEYVAFRGPDSAGVEPQVFGRELREAAKVDPLHALAMLFSPWANPDLFGRRGGWVAEWIRKKGK
jgi:transcriptional regulator with XRE-family HTH domain